MTLELPGATQSQVEQSVQARKKKIRKGRHRFGIVLSQAALASFLLVPANSVSVVATQTRRLSKRERRLAISWIVSLGIESKPV